MFAWASGSTGRLRKWSEINAEPEREPGTPTTETGLPVAGYGSASATPSVVNSRFASAGRPWSADRLTTIR